MAAWLARVAQRMDDALGTVCAARSRASHDNFSALAVWLVEPLGEDEMPAKEA
jgi:hypothetical protein